MRFCWLALLATGCLAASPPPTIPPGTPVGPNGDPNAVVDLAVTDLACPRVDIQVLLTFDRHYLNGVDLHYLVEGCGQRALYAESCGTERCAYFLASKFSVGPTSAPATSRP